MRSEYASGEEVAAPPDGHVWGLVVYCRAESHSLFDRIVIPLTHECFAADPAPVSALIEFPICVHPTKQFDRYSTPQELLDCQIATYLMIDPDSGYAPPQWQSHVGSCIIARKDKKSLDKRHFEGLWQYNDMILDMFGDGPTGAEMRAEGIMSKDHFIEWFEMYKERMVDNCSNPEFWERVPPLF